MSPSNVTPIARKTFGPNTGHFAEVAPNTAAADAVGEKMANEALNRTYDFFAGEELPSFGLGTVIDVDGTRLYLVRDRGFNARWVTEDGTENPWAINGYDFDVVPEPEIDEYGTALRDAATLEPGDRPYPPQSPDAWPEDGYGIVTKVVRESSGAMTVELEGGHRESFAPGTQLRVRRPENDAVYYADSHDYWENVRATMNPRTDTMTLAQIVAEQSEDDFMAAAISNPNVTQGIIESASRHHNIRVRRLAVFHPNAAKETLQRIRDEAEAAPDMYNEQKKGQDFEEGSPAQDNYFNAMIESNDLLLKAADEQAGNRGIDEWEPNPLIVVYAEKEARRLGLRDKEAELFIAGYPVKLRRDRADRAEAKAKRDADKAKIDAARAARG